MNRSDNINELAAALAKAQGEIKGAVKDANNPFHRSMYADLQSVWDAIRGPLSSHGLSVVQFPEEIDGKLVLYTMLAHESGQWVASHLPITPGYTDKQGEFVPLYDPQAMGSAITYARRYSLQAAAGVAPMDDDGNAASGKDRHDVAPKGANLPRRPTETQEITGKWQDVICHIGKANGPIKGKRLGDLPADTLNWLKEKMDEKGAKADASERRLQAALAMREGEANPHDRIVETPPVNGSTEDPMKPILEVIDFNEIPVEVFERVARERTWFKDLLAPTPAEVTRWMDNMEAALGHCQAAMKAGEEAKA